MNLARLYNRSAVSIAIASLAMASGCSTQPPSTIETAEPLASEQFADVPVCAITWKGAANSKHATVGVFLDNGEFRTAYHAMEMVTGSGLFLGTNLKAFLNGVPVVWKTVASGKYNRNREMAEDWAELSIQPRVVETGGMPFDFETPLPAGTRIFIVGFDDPKGNVSDNMEMTGKRQVRSASVIETPKDQAESGANLNGVLFVKVDPPALRYGWSGSPALAEIDGKLKVIGTIINVNVQQKFLSSDIDWDRQNYAIVNRNGPKR